MEIKPVAILRSPFREKFGLSRQAGLNDSLECVIEFLPPYRDPQAIKGLDGFSHLWVIWEFSLPAPARSLSVRPPALGGNETMGVFATRSPFRPNPLGLSSLKIKSIEMDPDKGPLIHVLGADMMDGTRIYDIKPYLPFTDAHPDALQGFTRPDEWPSLEVVMPDALPEDIQESDILALRQSLRQDPRPRYHDDPDRIYGLKYKNWDIRFKVLNDNKLIVIGIV